MVEPLDDVGLEERGSREDPSRAQLPLPDLLEPDPVTALGRSSSHFACLWKTA